MNDRCGRMIKIRAFSSPTALTESIFELLTAQFRAASSGPTAVMLSGGSTPLAAYTLIARQPVETSNTLLLLFSDDRHVPPDSPKSNYGATLPMITALALPPKRVLRVFGELPLAEATAKFDREIGTFLNGGGVISLGLLGLGTDGHTASLFCEADIESARGYHAVAVKRPDGLNGVSVTPGVIARVERVIFLVAGREKRDMLKKLLSDTLSIPAGRAVADNKNVEVWCDPDAYPL